MIVTESAFGDAVKTKGQGQSESKKDVSTSEYLLKHCHVATASTARLHNKALRMSLYVRVLFG